MLDKFLKQVLNRKQDYCTAVIVAAGRASRMKGEDKILSVLEGKEVIARSIEAFEVCTSVQEIIVVTRTDLIEPIENLCRNYGYRKVTAVVEGGDTREESVMRGLDRITEKTGLAAIHDGARPLVTETMIEDTINKARVCHAAAPAVPMKDTIKVAHNHVITNTPDRAALFAVQTPQIFDFDLLRAALENVRIKKIPVTDDCSAVEALGMNIWLTEGSEENIKITTPMDLIVAEAILKRRAEV